MLAQSLRHLASLPGRSTGAASTFGRSAIRRASAGFVPSEHLNRASAGFVPSEHVIRASAGFVPSEHFHRASASIMLSEQIPRASFDEPAVSHVQHFRHASRQGASEVSDTKDSRAGRYIFALGVGCFAMTSASAAHAVENAHDDVNVVDAILGDAEGQWDQSNSGHEAGAGSGAYMDVVRRVPNVFRRCNKAPHRVDGPASEVHHRTAWAMMNKGRIPMPGDRVTASLMGALNSAFKDYDVGCDLGAVSDADVQLLCSAVAVLPGCIVCPGEGCFVKQPGGVPVYRSEHLLRDCPRTQCWRGIVSRTPGVDVAAMETLGQRVVRDALCNSTNRGAWSVFERFYCDVKGAPSGAVGALVRHPHRHAAQHQHAFTHRGERAPPTRGAQSGRERHRSPPQRREHGGVVPRECGAADRDCHRSPCRDTRTSDRLYARTSGADCGVRARDHAQHRPDSADCGAGMQMDLPLGEMVAVMGSMPTMVGFFKQWRAGSSGMHAGAARR